jgi:P27 family predicted phage terminase small subunit
MAKGRPRKPTAIKRAEGNPGEHALPKEGEEPAPPPGLPVAPKFLNGEALKIWNDAVIPIAGVMGVATTADAHALGRYCHALVLWQKAAAFLDANGSTYPIRARDPVWVEKPDPANPGQVIKTATYPVTSIAQYPQVAEYRLLTKTLLAFETEYGFTAAARARLIVKGGAADPAHAEEDAEMFGPGDGGPIKFPKSKTG